LKRAEVKGPKPSLLDEILESYGSPGRHYHTKEHLRHMFGVYDRFFSNQTLVQELTFWYHDFFYDATRQDNEDRSASLAQKRVELDLHLASPIGANVKELILFSHYTRPPVSRDERVLHDVDLAIFGEAPSLFERYEKSIRLEYFFVPEGDYRKGRASILRMFLRDPFYFTPEMHNSSYEELAQRNIRRSIELLEAI